MLFSLLTSFALLVPLLAAGNFDYCFPRGFGGTDNPLCFSFERVGADYLFAMNCTPDAFPEFSVGWCALGLSTLSPMPASWGMWPAEVFHLQVARGADNATSVVLTDRLTTGVRLPACMPTQEARLLNATVDAATGVLTAFFTRKATLPPIRLAEGYTNLNRTLPIIAAISNNQGPATPPAGCDGTFPPHDNEWWGNKTASFD